VSPEEWAKKIRDLINEAEHDLDRSTPSGGEYWLVIAGSHSPDFVLQKYEGGCEAGERISIW